MDSADRDLLRSFARDRLGLDLGDAFTAAIDRFLDLLGVWNPRIRLTGERNPRVLVKKHVADSLACLAIMPSAGRVLDLGSGAGFPGVVVACARPDLDMLLLDSRQKAVSFLGEVIRTVPLARTRAVAMRAEDAVRDPGIGGRQQVVTARAVRMDVFVRLAKPLLAPGGLAVSMQTPQVEGEAAARIGARHGLEVARIVDYELPSGERRRLVAWR